MDNDRGKIIASLDEVQKKCQGFSRELVFNVENEQTRVAVCLYGSIIEYGEALATMARLDRWIGFGPTLRAMLEAYVDLRNVISRPAYVRHMEAAYLNKREKILREALKGNNDFLAAIGESPDTKTQLQSCRDRIRDLAKQNFSMLSVSERFERADMASEYRSAYSFLCNESHNDLLTLFKRHIEVREGQRPSIVFFGDPRPRDRVAEIFEAMELSLFATEAIFEHCKQPLPKEYDAWKKPIVEDLAETIERLQLAEPVAVSLKTERGKGN